MRNYLPDFIVVVDDGHGEKDLLHLVVEIKGYRREDAKEKKSTMDTYWVPGVNHLGTFGRWAFAELTDVYLIGSDFREKVESAFGRMVDTAISRPPADFGGLIGRAGDYIASQLGPSPAWRRISDEIWSVITTRSEKAFYLSDIAAVSKIASVEEGEVLPVLSLLSRPSGPFLRMRFQSELSTDPGALSAALFERLTRWWKQKTISDEEWRDWASNIKVDWVPRNPGEVS
jgi:type III restriction enzyme